MSVGFNHKIVFANTGKVSDFQKCFNDNYGKLVSCYLPLDINNRKHYTAVLSIAINNTFPLQIVDVYGKESETDLNCYQFDVSEVYRQYHESRRIGLAKLTLKRDSGRNRFQSETFRIT